MKENKFAKEIESIF